MTFEALKELSTKTYSIKDEVEGLKALKVYIDEYINYFKCIYPEMIDYISICYQYLENFDILKFHRIPNILSHLLNLLLFL